MSRIAIAVAGFVVAFFSISGARASDAPSCGEVRRVRAWVHSRALDERALVVAERDLCRDNAGDDAGFHEGDHDHDGGHGGIRPRDPGRQSQSALSDEEFDQKVLSRIRFASRSEETTVCREWSHRVWVTSAQVRSVIQAVGADNEAACALAFYPSVVDKMEWEVVYLPMSSAAERQVREALANE